MKHTLNSTDNCCTCLREALRSDLLGKCLLGAYLTPTCCLPCQRVSCLQPGDDPVNHMGIAVS